MAKKVALVLASGGARGMAHIGAIEELVARGYQITSIAGCSIGSLIAGIYAAGKISEARDWFCSLDARDVLSLTDFSIGLSHLVKGDRVMQAIQEWVPDRKIEDLPIPATFVATDVLNSEEVIFRSGSLFEAIRASISIPMCFEPFRWNDTLLVDGGLTNPFPLDRVERTEGDILVGINISGRTRMTAERTLRDAPDFLNKMAEMTGNVGRMGQRLIRQWDKVSHDMNDDKLAPSFNYLTLVNRTIDVQIQANCQTRIQMCNPDIVVNMAQDAYTTFDFAKAAEIIDKGRELMGLELDRYEMINGIPNTRSLIPADQLIPLTERKKKALADSKATKKTAAKRRKAKDAATEKAVVKKSRKKAASAIAAEKTAAAMTAAQNAVEKMSEVVEDIWEKAGAEIKAAKDKRQKKTDNK